MSFSRMARAFSRKLTTSSIRSAAEGPSATSGHTGGMKLWRLLSFTVAVPGVALCMINAYLKELEHMAHPHRPDFVPYEYMRVRTHKFPWGDGNHSLFHNPKFNALPDGYEVELEEPSHHH